MPIGTILLPMVASTQALLDLEEGHVTSAALKAFFGIMDEWDLGNEDARVLLGSPSRTTFHRMKRLEVPKLSHDRLERISYLLGIYKALNILLPDAQIANAWIKQPNAAAPFNGQSASERLLAGNVVDLADVRRYLDAERGH